VARSDIALRFKGSFSFDPAIRASIPKVLQLPHCGELGTSSPMAITRCIFDVGVGVSNISARDVQLSSAVI